MEKKYRDKKWLYEQYITFKKSSNEIAKECELSSGNTVLKWLKKFNIPRRNLSDACKGIKKSEETKQKISKGLKGRTFSKQHRERLSKSSKGKKLSEETKQKISALQLSKRPSAIYREKEWLYYQYHELRKSLNEIATFCNCASNTIKNWMIKFNIPLRTKHEALKGRIGEKNAFYGKHHTQETKIRISKAQKGKIISEKTRKKISKATKKAMECPEIKRKISGSNHYNWNPNRQERYSPYNVNFYDEGLRNQKWNLQNGRDLLTGKKIVRGSKSHYHHIDYDKSNDELDNLCWLSIRTHAKITGYQYSNPIKAEYYKRVLQKNTQLLKEGKIPKSWAKKNKEMFRQENLVQLKLPINQIIEKE